MKLLRLTVPLLALLFAATDAFAAPQDKKDDDKKDEKKDEEKKDEEKKDEAKKDDKEEKKDEEKKEEAKKDDKKEDKKEDKKDEVTSVAATEPPPAVAPTDALFTSDLPPTKDKETGKSSPGPRRWANTQLFGQVGISPQTFAPGLTQTADPTVDMFWLFQPRFALNKEFQVRALMSFSYEFTDNYASGTTRSNEPRIGDILPSLAFMGTPAVVGFKPIFSISSTIPISPESRARGLVTTPGISMAIAKPIEKFLGGEATWIVSFGYSHPFYSGATTPSLENHPNYNPTCFAGSGQDCALQSSGAANPENSILMSTVFTATWGKFNPGILLRLTDTWVYKFQEIPGVGTIEHANTLRQSTYFAAFVDWNFNAWLTAEIGYQASMAVIGADGKYNFFMYDQYADMRVYFGANFGLDKLYDAINGKAAKAGIVRVKNDRGPAVQF